MQQGKGDLLLPGAYDSSDFILESARKIETFGFKAVDRESGPKIGHGCGDKVYISHHASRLSSASMLMDNYNVKVMQYIIITCTVFILIVLLHVH